MVNGIMEFAGKAVGKAKNVIFADPRLLYDEERNLINKPFFFEGTNGKGVLLVHGWTSTPYEVRRLGKYLNENGYTVLGIQLTGHGTVPKDLEGVKWGQWLNDVRDGYEKLAQTCEKVFIGGTSIGANLALVFAKEKKEIAGLILMATPNRLKFENVVILFAKTLKIFGRYRKKYYPPTFGARKTITRLISYQTYPIDSALETFELIKYMRNNLAAISQPVLIMQSTHDHIVEKNSMEIIHEKVSSTVKKKIYINKAYHTFISDIKNEHIFQDILDFIENN
jgi:carboxylesterase